MSFKVVSRIVVKQESRKKRTLKEGTADYKVSSPYDAYALAAEYIQGNTAESMLAIALDTKNKIIAVYNVFNGVINACNISAREIYQFALLNNASGLILAHNHPSGDITPSPQDLTVTQRLAEAGAMIGVELLDHLIVGDTDYWSIREHDSHLFVE